MQTSSSRSLWLGHRQYWLCQGIFWLAIAGPELGTLLVKGGNAKGADTVLISALLQTAAGLLATHLYRFLLIRSGWRERKLGFLWWRMSLVVGAAACLTSLPASLFLYQEAQNQIRETVEKLPAAQAIIDEAPLRFGEAWVSLGATDALIQVAWVIIYLAAKAQRSLAAARRREQELQSALKESELSALRAHLNPHFFFNTLNTLRTLIDLNPAQARLAVDHLADLMRLTLRIGSQRAVPLRTELSMVQAYLDLEKMRFEERLIIVDEIQPDTLDQAGARVRKPNPPARMKALIVDDERLARLEFRRLLAAHPEVEICGEAANGPEALVKIGELRPDVVFLDIQMPTQTGFELLEALPGPLPQIVFVSAYDEHALRAFDFAASDYLVKPVSAARLGLDSHLRAPRARTSCG